MGISNTAGTILGILGVSITGLILHYTGAALIFQVTAGVTLVDMFSICAGPVAKKNFRRVVLQAGYVTTVLKLERNK